MNFLSSERKDSEGMCSWAFVLIHVSVLHLRRFSPLGFLCDSTAELQLSPTAGHTHSPPPKHTSFLRVTEWVKNEDTPTLPASQSRTEKIRDGHTAVRPDCYKHFTPRFKTYVLDQVYIYVYFFYQLFINMLISKVNCALLTFKPKHNTNSFVYCLFFTTFFLLKQLFAF